MSNQTKNTSSYTNGTSTSSTWDNLTKTLSSWTNQVASTLNDYLLKEDTYFLLLETGDKIIIYDGQYTNQAKNSTTYTNKEKN
jgi:hypothetical protein